MKSINAGTLQFLENWKVTRVDNITGKILDTEEICNTIVDDGLERVAKLINNVDGTYFRALAIGTGVTAEQSTDVALQTEFTRALATLSYEASFKAKFTKTFSFGSGVAEDITEAGIFDSSIESGSVMLARTTFPAKSVSSSIDLIVTATITVSRV